MFFWDGMMPRAKVQGVGKQAWPLIVAKYSVVGGVSFPPPPPCPPPFPPPGGWKQRFAAFSTRTNSPASACGRLGLLIRLCLHRHGDLFSADRQELNARLEKKTEAKAVGAGLQSCWVGDVGDRSLRGACLHVFEERGENVGRKDGVVISASRVTPP